LGFLSEAGIGSELMGRWLLLWGRRRGFDDGRQRATERVGHGVVAGGRGAGIDRDAVIDRSREMRSIHVSHSASRSFV
jgi:hypothetical protein